MFLILVSLLPTQGNDTIPHPGHGMVPVTSSAGGGVTSTCLSDLSCFPQANGHPLSRAPSSPPGRCSSGQRGLHPATAVPTPSILHPGDSSELFSAALTHSPPIPSPCAHSGLPNCSLWMGSASPRRANKTLSEPSSTLHSGILWLVLHNKKQRTDVSMA